MATTNNVSGDVGSKISGLFGDIFGKNSIWSNIFTWFMKLFFGIDEIFTGIDKAKKAEEKEKNPGVDLDSEDDKDGRFTKSVSKLQDRAHLNKLWRDNPNSKEAWDALEQELEANGLFTELNKVLKHRESEVLAKLKNYTLGTAPGAGNPVTVYERILADLKRRFANATPEEQAEICFKRQEMLAHFQVIQDATAVARQPLETATQALAVIQNEREQAARQLKKLEDAKTAGETVSEGLITAAQAKLQAALTRETSPEAQALEATVLAQSAIVRAAFLPHTAAFVNDLNAVSAAYTAESNARRDAADAAARAARGMTPALDAYARVRRNPAATPAELAAAEVALRAAPMV